MQLNRFTDLGLRVLLYLQASKPGQRTKIADMAERFEVSHPHLMKVVQFMGQQGWLLSTQGPGGGVRLALADDAYRLGDVVRQLERTVGMIDCTTPPCALRGQCLLKEALLQAEDAFYASLNQFTLTDAVQNPTREAVLRLHRMPSRRTP